MSANVFELNFVWVIAQTHEDMEHCTTIVPSTSVHTFIHRPVVDELSEDGYKLVKNLRQRRTAEEISLIESYTVAQKHSEVEVNMLIPSP